MRRPSGNFVEARYADLTLGNWLNGLEARMYPNKAVVALAAKMARIVWAVLNKPGALYGTQGSCFRLTLRARLQGSGRVMTKQWISMPKTFAKKRASCPNHLLGTACADLIMAWLQQQSTRERPDTFMQLESSSAMSRNLARTGRTIHF
jgi:hypothetical protein